MARHKKLDWFRDPELIEQLKGVPMGSKLRQIRIAPTDEDCAHSRQGRPTLCAISTALRRMLGSQATFVCTKPNRITVTVSKHYLHFELPNEGPDAIFNYDAYGTKPPPLTYTLGEIRDVVQASEDRKKQINAARNKRRAQGKPDKTYRQHGGMPLRLRTSKLLTGKIAPRQNPLPNSGAGPGGENAPEIKGSKT
jgi:hypothetical protein